MGLDFTTDEDWRLCKDDFDAAREKLPHLEDDEPTARAFIAGWLMAQSRFG